MTFKEAYKSLNLKFTSGNSIPVERNTILVEEWNAIKNKLEMSIIYRQLSIILGFGFIVSVIYSFL